jgi:hypothetical protein
VSDTGQDGGTGGEEKYEGEKEEDMEKVIVTSSMKLLISHTRAYDKLKTDES